MDSTIVIKVKYHEILRRFNARVNEDGQLDLDVDGLRGKVIGFFNFAPNTDFTLTYLDEDGDVVTLVDEEDLCDVMRQSLNPLRITVQLSAEKGGSSYSRSSGNSTPRKSARVEQWLPKLSTGALEILRSIPEPSRESLLKASLDLVTKAAPCGPGFGDLLEFISRMLGSTNPVSDFQAGKLCSMQGQNAGSGGDASMSKVTDASGSGSSVLEEFSNTKREVHNSKPCLKEEVVNSTKGVDATVTPASGSLNLNSYSPDDAFVPGSVPANTGPVPVNLNSCSPGDALVVGSVPANICPVPVTLQDGNSTSKLDVKKFGSSAPTVDNIRSSFNDSKTKIPGVNASSKFPGPNLIGECLANDLALPYNHFGPRVHPFKRSYNHSSGMGSIFHRGVRCDGCGVHPITGPRFKSKVKEDYDLCSICFSVIGNEADFIRMDHPVSHRHPACHFKGMGDSMQRIATHHPIPRVVRGGNMKPSRPKLDSRFIMDVNVQDGTVMAPATRFTKIWQMRNNGTTVWPRGTQLVWIGGDKLSDAFSVELQISVDGIPVEKELDVAVDFTAPQLPGRYISYWRMASPSGQKFGQRVWVLIQVDASLSEALCNSFQGLNLNLPPDSSGIVGPESVNENVEPMPMEGSLPEPNVSDRATELVEPLMDPKCSKDPEINFPTNDTLLVGETLSKVVHPDAPMYPMIDLYEVAPAVPPSTLSPSFDLSATAKDTDGHNDVEKTLLKELEAMGFKQVDLNKEVLRMNEYDLQQSVDDLCSVAEWDPMLEELQEMGFCDKEVNKRLLKKNNGSIKRVVMDLIYGEKA